MNLKLLNITEIISAIINIAISALIWFGVKIGSVWGKPPDYVKIMGNLYFFISIFMIIMILMKIFSKADRLILSFLFIVLGIALIATNIYSGLNSKDIFSNPIIITLFCSSFAMIGIFLYDIFISIKK